MPRPPRRRAALNALILEERACKEELKAGRRVDADREIAGRCSSSCVKTAFLPPLPAVGPRCRAAHWGGLFSDLPRCSLLRQSFFRHGIRFPNNYLSETHPKSNVIGILFNSNFCGDFATSLAQVNHAH